MLTSIKQYLTCSQKRSKVPKRKLTNIKAKAKCQLISISMQKSAKKNRDKKILQQRMRNILQAPGLCLKMSVLRLLRIWKLPRK